MENLRNLIFRRMKLRAGHFMTAEMLRSQFEDFEAPAGALVADIRKELNVMASEIIEKLGLSIEMVHA